MWFFGLAPMASFVRLCLACLLSCALAGRNGGRGHRQPAYGGTADVANPRPGPQVVRLEVAVCDKATRGDGSRERRRQDHHDHGQGRRSRRSDEAPFSHAATTRDKRRRTHKKKKKRSSSSSSTSSSSSSSHAKKQKRNVKLQAGKKEDKLVEEIQKLRESLKQHPETPAKKPSGDSRLQLTPKGQSHLKTLCSFIHEGEPTQLIDVAAIHSWADVEEQLQAKTLPVLKEYLSTRCKPDDIPSRKAAAISKVVSLIRDALPS